MIVIKHSLLLRFANLAAAVGLLQVSTSSRGASGDLYVTETDGTTIFKFASDGSQATFASGIGKPRGLAFDGMGNLFVAEAATGSILKITSDGTRTTFASDLRDPIALAFDGAGNLYVADNGPCDADCGMILRFTPAGEKSTFNTGYNFRYLAFDLSGILFAAIGGPTFQSGGIVKFTPDGQSEVLSASGGPGIAFDTSGSRFEANFNNLILEFTGTETVFFTSEVDQPFGLAFDGEGNLYETDSGSGSILKFSPDGSRTVFASGLTQPSYLAFEPVTEKLRNISARALVGTEDNVLIGGFIVGGNALANNAVLVRAIGPSLSQAGVSNPLADPALELHNASGALIASNDDWQDDQETEITATGLAPGDPNESTIYATLPAGSYTAVVRGAGDTTGVALVEVYSVSQ